MDEANGKFNHDIFAFIFPSICLPILLDYIVDTMVRRSSIIVHRAPIFPKLLMLVISLIPNIYYIFSATILNPSRYLLPLVYFANLSCYLTLYRNMFLILETYSMSTTLTRLFGVIQFFTLLIIYYKSWYHWEMVNLLIPMVSLFTISGYLLINISYQAINQIERNVCHSHEEPQMLLLVSFLSMAVFIIGSIITFSLFSNLNIANQSHQMSFLSYYSSFQSIFNLFIFLFQGYLNKTSVILMLKVRKYNTFQYICVY